MGAGGGYCVMSSHVVGHAIRAAMGTVWKTCMFAWPGCMTGDPSGTTSHQALTTICPYLLTHDTPTVLPSCTPTPQPPRKCPLHWCSLHSYWPFICFRSLALFLRDLHFPSNTTPCAPRVVKYWHHLLQSQKEWKWIHEGWSSRRSGKREKETWRSLMDF